MRRPTAKRSAIAVIPLGLVLGAGWMQIEPSSDRDWAPGLDIMPRTAFDGDLATIDGVRNFHWRTLDDFDVRYETRTVDLSTVDSLWFCLSIFDPQGWRGPAHSLLSFGFEDGTYLAVSVEARKERGESYSVWKGLAKRFELAYVIGDERDLIANRAALRPDSVELYPIRADRHVIAAILRDVLESANRLHERPEFYDTVRNNCTTRLRDHVERVVPGTIPASWKVVLPGYADELLESLHLIDSDLPLDEERRTFDVKQVATEFHDASDFSRKIRAGLPRRTSAPVPTPETPTVSRP